MKKCNSTKAVMEEMERFKNLSIFLSSNEKREKLRLIKLNLDRLIVEGNSCKSCIDEAFKLFYALSLN